jgi:hypothetical protein
LEESGGRDVMIAGTDADGNDYYVMSDDGRFYFKEVGPWQELDEEPAQLH